MPFLWTLQRYIFREMGKTFLLTAIALTGVLGLGGGVVQIIKLGDVGAGQLVQVLLLMMPLAVALTLPIAALFSAAATYGRLSADNEFVACRSSGINLHVLFLPAVALSLASAAVTFVLSNFLIPGMVRNLNEFLFADITTIVQRKLDTPGGLKLGAHRFYADRAVVDPSNPNRITLYNGAFVELDADEWDRFGTAREIRLDIVREAERPRILITLLDLCYFDRSEGSGGTFADYERQTLSYDGPLTIRMKIKYLNLRELLHYRSRPGTWADAREEMDHLRQALARRRVYDSIEHSWVADQRFTLGDTSATYVVESKQAARLPREGGFELTEVNLEEKREGRRRSMKAGRAILGAAGGHTFAESGVKIELYGVQLSDGADWIERDRETIGPVLLDPALVTEFERLSDEELIEASRLPEQGDPLALVRGRAEEARAGAARRIESTLHERMAFSISVVFLVILGVALGIIFRGSHVLTAFGISFIPSLLVIITIVMGKQLSHNASTHWLGLLVMWSGIAVVVGLDAWTVTRVLRR